MAISPSLFSIYRSQQQSVRVLLDRLGLDRSAQVACELGLGVTWRGPDDVCWQYTGERDVKTPADFGGDKANNDDDEDGSDDPGECCGLRMEMGS